MTSKYKYFYADGIKRIHSECLPENFRMLIVGATGAGKTALLMKLLLEPNLLNYDKLYVFAKSLYQPEYQVLKAGFQSNLPKTDILELLNAGTKIKKYESSIDELALALKLDNEEKGIEPSLIESEFHTDPDNILDPSELDMSIRNLIVFDDIMTDRKQTTAESYYTRSRSANSDCIYLSQNYSHLPLHTVRTNANFMIFFKSSPMVVEQLYRNFASVDMEDIKMFKQFCKEAWEKKYGYIVIDLSQDDDGNKYRFSLELAQPRTCSGLVSFSHK
jgi:ASC-1-like (ASCH) protein